MHNISLLVLSMQTLEPSSTIEVVLRTGIELLTVTAAQTLNSPSSFFVQDGDNKDTQKKLFFRFRHIFPD